jgi:hypothetical protein
VTPKRKGSLRWPAPERHPTAAPLKHAGAVYRQRFTATRGQADDAIALATHADRLLHPTDLLPLRADVLTDLASAHAARGDTAKARRAAEHALALYTEKGNIVAAQRGRNAYIALSARTLASSGPRSHTNPRLTAIKAELIGQFERPKSAGTSAATATPRPESRSRTRLPQPCSSPPPDHKGAGALVAIMRSARSCTGRLLLSKARA